MMYTSTTVLWLQNANCYLFDYFAETSCFRLLKVFETISNSHGVFEHLSQSGISEVQIYFGNQTGYLFDSHINFDKKECVKLLNQNRVAVSSEDLIRCQNLGQKVFIQILHKETVDFWQKPMEEYGLRIAGMEFPEQICLSLMPKNLRTKGFHLLMGDSDISINLCWQFNYDNTHIHPMAFRPVRASEFVQPPTDLPLLVNQKLLKSIPDDVITNLNFPVFSLEEAWEMSFNESDLKNIRCAFLMANYRSPNSFKSLQPWRKTIIRLTLSLAVLIVLVRLATPKLNQNYAIAPDRLDSKATSEILKRNDRGNQLPSVPLNIKARLEHIRKNINGMKHNLEKVESENDIKANYSPKRIVSPVLNYLSYAEDNRCGEFQLGLQKLRVCLNQDLLGRTLHAIDSEKSTWLDQKASTTIIPRVSLVKGISTRILNVPNENKFLVELSSDDSSTMIVDSWEGQPLKSEQDAEVLAEAVSMGVLSQGRKDQSSQEN